MVVTDHKPLFHIQQGIRMPLLEKIDQDMKQAMLAKDADRLSVIRFLKSALKYAAIEKKMDALSDADAMLVIQKQIKQRRESIEQFRANGRADMAAKEEKEASILEGYLPKQLSDAELQKIVEAESAALGAATKKDFGRLMKHLTEKLAGSADNKRLSAELGKILK